MTNKVTAIECVISNGLSIRLENLKEVYGHDDSLPFNADVFVYDVTDESGCFHKIATAYNDGWGGESIIEPTQSRYQKQLNEIDNYLRNNFEIVCNNKIKWDVTLEYLISSMACYGIDGGIRKFSINKLEDIKVKH